MNETIWNRLKSTGAPYVHLVVQPIVDLEKWLISHGEICTCIIDSKKCKTLSEFFEAISKALGLPSYFNNNWDSLDECLSDMEWMQEYQGWLIIFEYADDLLCHSPKSLGTLIDLLNSVGQEWSESRDIGLEHTQNPRSFHVVFQLNKQDCIHKYDVYGISDIMT